MDSKEAEATCPKLDDQNMKDSDSLHSRSTNADDMLDIDVDPTYLVESVSNLKSISESTASTLSFLKDMHPGQIFMELDNTFHLLYSRLCDLEQIAASYAVVSHPNQTDHERYIDPNIMKWLSDCMVCLLSIQAKVEEELDWRSTAIANDEIDIESVSIVESTTTLEVDTASENWTLVESEVIVDQDLVRENEHLKDLVERLAAFIPIFAADLTDYHLAGSHILPNRTSDYLERLRCHLYELKDELKSYINLVPKLVEVFPKDLSQRFISLKDVTILLERTLTTYLTNNGSEWLDSLLSGGLSFSEFRRLDISRFVNASRELKHCNRDFEIERKTWDGPVTEETADDKKGEKEEFQNLCNDSSKLEQKLEQCERLLNTLKESLKVTSLDCGSQ